MYGGEMIETTVLLQHFSQFEYILACKNIDSSIPIIHQSQQIALTIITEVTKI